ncbi:hypothetical protein NL676_025708 [Syzygium grande]|nr:hypothetical protein NL676_025708 [Syzygium grande]
MGCVSQCHTRPPKLADCYMDRPNGSLGRNEKLIVVLSIFQVVTAISVTNVSPISGTIERKICELVFRSELID